MSTFVSTVAEVATIPDLPARTNALLNHHEAAVLATMPLTTAAIAMVIAMLIAAGVTRVSRKYIHSFTVARAIAQGEFHGCKFRQSR